MASLSPVAIKRIVLVLLAALASVVAITIGTTPAHALTCPPGVWSGNPVLDYCETTPTLFKNVITSQVPNAYFRLNDTDSTLAPYFDGVTHWGVSASTRTARTPGRRASRATATPRATSTATTATRTSTASRPRARTTASSAIRLRAGSTRRAPAPARSWDFGGAGSIYVAPSTIPGPDNHVYFSQQSDTVENTSVAILPHTWYMAAVTKDGFGHVHLYVQASQTGTTPVWFSTSSATATFHAPNPGGSPTFYIGYGVFAPWFNGAIDEVAYFTRPLSYTELATQYYADPAPSAASMIRTHAVVSGPPADTGVGVGLGSGDTGGSSGGFSSNSSNSPKGVPDPILKARASKPISAASKLLAATTQVGSLTTSLSTAKSKLKHLRRSTRARRRSRPPRRRSRRSRSC